MKSFRSHTDRFLRKPLFTSIALLLTVANASIQVTAQTKPTRRLFQPEDLFRSWQVGATAWSPDGHNVAIEMLRPNHVLDRGVPSGEIRLLDVRTRTFRTLSPTAEAYLGFFNMVWSQSGTRLAFLSVDANAVVQPWVWTVDTERPKLLNDLDVRVGIADRSVAWIGDDRLALLAWQPGAKKSGPLYLRIMRGRNVADGWKRVGEVESPTVSTLESGGPTKVSPPSARLITVDLRTGARRTLARGSLHRISVSNDNRFLSFMREVPGRAVASYVVHEDVEEGYSDVNWGTEHHVIDAQTGAETAPSSISAEVPPQKSNITIPRPRGDARQISVAPNNDAALFLANASDGSHLWISGGGGRPLSSTAEIWRANEWVRQLDLGTDEPITFTATDNTPLLAWLLLPPNYVKGNKIPVITIVYPGLTYSATTPLSFSPLQGDFEHPQLFAALGYGVLLPSMPAAKEPTESHALSRLPNGVLPAVDAAIARGIADPDRIAVLGQSDGGFAVLGLITQTTRFRSAIASAGFSDLVSLYGTLYGQYRYGDAGQPEAGQLLRMLQLEKGADGLAGPPWAQADRYRENSAVLNADKVTTPLMLVHGDLDFIPIQQDEEFFTALYRQDKRVILVRYQGEGHTIASRANVLDLWSRIADWLKETMKPR